MDSAPIAEFLETTYPSPPLPLSSELGRSIESQARLAVGAVFRAALTPREVDVLSPRAAEYFRQTREAKLGHPIEKLGEGDKEEKAWQVMDEKVRAASELMSSNKTEGPFVLGARPSYSDFVIAGALQNARMIHEPTFTRITEYSGFGDIYEACLPWMEQRT
jgi:glutathione S-transferase